MSQCMVEDGPIMSVKYCLPVSVFYFWPKLMHSAARLSVIAELFVNVINKFNARGSGYVLERSEITQS